MKIQVTCALIEQYGRVLITQRSSTMANALLWEFPGGKIEPGEKEEDCLIREIQEELNLSIVPVKRMTPVEITTEGRTIELIPYLCEYKHGTIQLAEHRAYQWVSPSDLQLYDWCPADKPVVDEFVQLTSG
jgi:8-oxo-dGTP diphosphatase